MNPSTSQKETTTKEEPEKPEESQAVQVEHFISTRAVQSCSQFRGHCAFNKACVAHHAVPNVGRIETNDVADSPRCGRSKQILVYGDITGCAVRTLKPVHKRRLQCRRRDCWNALHIAGKLTLLCPSSTVKSRIRIERMRHIGIPNSCDRFLELTSG